MDHTQSDKGHFGETITEDNQVLLLIAVPEGQRDRNRHGSFQKSTVPGELLRVIFLLSQIYKAAIADSIIILCV